MQCSVINCTCHVRHYIPMTCLFYNWKFVYLHPFCSSLFPPPLWVCAQLLSHVWPFATLWTIVHQALQFMGFLRQEYWSGLPFPSPGYLPNPGIKLVSLAFPSLADRFFTSEPPGKPLPPFSGNHQFVLCIYKLVIFYYLKLLKF